MIAITSGRSRRGSVFPSAKMKKSLPREEVRQAFDKTERQLGGGVLPFPQATLGGGWGACMSEGMREKVHRFDGNNHTYFLLSS
ncbi:hypothetical protein [Rhizobium sp. BR 249]|uniref:hypothetical protein n=1 Tax=Rhizobium sp. BR 249 TaxID=3040011 RepID=UPI0039BF0266